MRFKERWNIFWERLKNFKLDANTFTFLFFLLVSTIFWFFNALNNEYIATINIPVKFVNFPENKLVAGDFVNKLEVKIEANGYSFLKYKSSPFKAAVINLQLHSIYKVSEAEDDKRFYLLSSTIQNEIAAQFDGATTIKSIKPDSIIFVLDEVIKKKVPVVKRLKLEFRKQFMLNDSVKLIPDSIDIRGVKTALDTIDKVYTEQKTYTDLHDSVVTEITLEPINSIAFSQNKVKCIIPVEEFAEISFSIPIEIENLPHGYNMKLFPSQAEVVCNVVFSEYRQVFPQQFKVVVDYNDTKENLDRLKVSLRKYPPNVSSVRYYPIAVEYLVEEND